MIIKFKKDTIKEVINKYVSGPGTIHRQNILKAQKLWKETHGTTLRRTKKLIPKAEVKKFLVAAKEQRLIKKRYVPRIIVNKLVREKKQEIHQKWEEAHKKEEPKIDKLAKIRATQALERLEATRQDKKDGGQSAKAVSTAKTSSGDKTNNLSLAGGIPTTGKTIRPGRGTETATTYEVRAWEKSKPTSPTAPAIKPAEPKTSEIESEEAELDKTESTEAAASEPDEPDIG